METGLAPRYPARAPLTNRNKSKLVIAGTLLDDLFERLRRQSSVNDHAVHEKARGPADSQLSGLFHVGFDDLFHAVGFHVLLHLSDVGARFLGHVIQELLTLAEVLLILEDE